MRKFIFSFLMLFSVMFANAQTAVESQKLFDNVYFGAGAQVSTPLDLDGVFPVNPAVVFTLGKEFTPVFGASVEGDFWLGSRYSGSKSSRFDYIGGPHNFVRGSYLGVNSTINLTNLFKGYLGAPRKFEIQTVTGLGWSHVFRPNISDKNRDDLSAKTGLNLNFNLGANKAHTIYLQPAVLWDLTTPASHHDRVAFNKKGAQLALGVGYIYHFKTSNGTHYFKTYDVGMMMDEISRLNQDLAACENRPPREVTREVRVPVQMPTFEVIEFELGSYELLDEAKAKLDKIDSHMTVEITATASPDGPEQLNKELSDKRAQAVADYLKDKGVTVKSAEGLGVKLNRLATVTFVRPERPRR